MDDTKPKTWRAILTPHRSLSPKGFVILMSVIAGFNFIVGLFFYVIGAWPVAWSSWPRSRLLADPSSWRRRCW